jgi:hypothetical protein
MGVLLNSEIAIPDANGRVMPVRPLLVLADDQIAENRRREAQAAVEFLSVLRINGSVEQHVVTFALTLDFEGQLAAAPTVNTIHFADAVLFDVALGLFDDLIDLVIGAFNANNEDDFVVFKHGVCPFHGSQPPVGAGSAARGEKVVEPDEFRQPRILHAACTVVNGGIAL